MRESYGGEHSQESDFIDRLGLVNTEQIERARKVLDTYLLAIKEVTATSVGFTPDDRIVEDLGGDSLTLLVALEIIQDIEDIELPTERFDGVKTLGEGFKVVVEIINEGPNDNLGGVREPRNPLPSDLGGSVMQDLIF